MDRYSVFLFKHGNMVSVILSIVILGGCVGKTQKPDEENAIKEKAKFNATKAQLALFEMPLENYNLDIGVYPSTNQGLEAMRNPPSDLPNHTAWSGPYFKENIPLDPWGRPYNYASPGRYNPNTYDVWSVGPDGVDGTADDFGNWHKQ
jgi:general secretion pathway protein G